MNLTDAETLATSLMADHGLTKQGWRFSFDRSKVQFGCCHYKTKIVSLSRHLVQLNNDDEVRDTILHEIAHALTYERGFRHEHHGPVWKSIAVSIGCNGQRCYDSSTVERPACNWIGQCPNCGQVIERYRRRNIACGECCKKYGDGEWDSRFRFVWTENEVQSLRISQ